MKYPPKDWFKLLTPEIMVLLFQSEELKKTLEHAQDKYVRWDVFRHYTIPNSLSAEEAWALLKMSYRPGQETTPVNDISGVPFRYNLTKGLYRRISHVDTNASGFIKTLTTETTSSQREQLVMSGLIEEAIASSQIEGANTSRKVAKEMLYSGRKARNMAEQMIINNYQVMQHLNELKDLELSEDMLLDIQKRITHKTLENPSEAGRFRVDADEIAVIDKLTGEIAFDPPKEAQMRQELKRLIHYANAKTEADSGFVHPFIKATILHFWIAYLHPFTDGNGRTARAIFYWYLLKHNYWLFEYLSVSRIIKAAKKKYDQAFLDTEKDENDLTYFILYIAEVTCRAIDEMRRYYERKIKENEEVSRSAAKKGIELNDRQIALLAYFKEHRDKVTNIKRHQTVHGVVYETARQDLFELRDKGFVVETEKGRKKIFLPNKNAIKRFFN